MIFALTLSLSNPFPAHIERAICAPAVYLRQDDGELEPSEIAAPFYNPTLPAYFPNDSVDQFVCSWYSAHLQALEQEPLIAPSNQDVLRFTWLRSFHNPISISVALDGHLAGEITWNRTDGAGGYGPGTVIESDGRVLDVEDLDGLRAQLREANPCKDNEDREPGLDGAEWIFETLDSEYYCIISVWSPNPESPFGQLGLELLSLTDLSIAEREIY